MTSLRLLAGALAVLCCLACSSPQQECRDKGGYCLQATADGGCELLRPACCDGNSATPLCGPGTAEGWVAEPKAGCATVDRSVAQCL